MPGTSTSGNPNASGKIGNRGGGRLGYTYERDQLVKMRRLVDRALAKIEAFEKGRITEEAMRKFTLTMPFILKAMDKLHATKTQQDHTGEIKLIPVPIYAGESVKTIDVSVSRHDSDQKNLPTE